MNKSRIHPIQQAILEVGKNHNLDHLSLRELGSRVAVIINSKKPIYPQRIKHHLNQVKQSGHLYYDPVKETMRTKMRNKTIHGLFSIPILGAASCGNPSQIAQEDIKGYLRLSPTILKPRKSLFAVQAIGDSMNDADIKGESIDDGDYVIVDSSEIDVKDGDYVLSIVDGMANIKRIRIDKSREMVALLSESKKEYAPIFIHINDINLNSYLINGKVVRVVKQIH